MTSPRTPFFWSVKVREAKVAVLSSASVAVAKVKVSGANFKANVTETEGGGIRFGGGVFARTEKKEEGKDDHVGSGNGTDRGSSQGSKKDMPKDG